MGSNFVYNFSRGYCTYQFLIKNGYVRTAKQAAISTLVLFTGFGWYPCFHLGNQAGVILGLIMVAMYCLDTHPILAASLLAIAMCKPQITAVFFFPILATKRWKVLVTSTGEVVLAWIAAALMVHEGPLRMAKAMFDQGVGYGTAYYGLFNLLKYQGVGTKTILLMNTVFIIVAFVICCMYIKKNNLCQDTLLWFAIAAILSAVWFYHSQPDNVITTIAGVCIIIIAYRKWRSIYVYMLMVYTYWLPSLLKIAFIHLFDINVAIAYDVGNFIEMVLLCISLLALLPAAKKANVYKETMETAAVL